jgi:hypothetical protein
VIAALSEGESRRHVPYRDSKLTRLLQASAMRASVGAAVLRSTRPTSGVVASRSRWVAGVTRARRLLD